MGLNRLAFFLVRYHAQTQRMILVGCLFFAFLSISTLSMLAL